MALERMLGDPSAQTIDNFEPRFVQVVAGRQEAWSAPQPFLLKKPQGTAQAVPGPPSPLLKKLFPTIPLVVTWRRPYSVSVVVEKFRICATNSTGRPSLINSTRPESGSSPRFTSDLFGPSGPGGV